MPVLEDNDKIEENPPVDLDRVHEQTVNELEAETAHANEEDESKDDDSVTPENEQDDSGNDAGKPDNDEAGEGEEGDDTTTVPPEVAPTVEAPQPKVETPAPVVEPVLDTDITKNGNGKIGIKDSEGNQYYFNNMDELPDDFEPESYKAFGVFNSQMAVKAQSDARVAEEQRARKDAETQQAEIDEVTQRWDKEIEVLTKGGVLPTDEKEREAEVGDTYAYIAKNLSDGVVIDSFAAANKAMKFDREQEAKAKANKAKAEATKKRGSMVMGGGGGTPSGTKKETEPLPAGTSLDAVHAKYSGLN